MQGPDKRKARPAPAQAFLRELALDAEWRSQLPGRAFFFDKPQRSSLPEEPSAQLSGRRSLEGRLASEGTAGAGEALGEHAETKEKIRKVPSVTLHEREAAPPGKCVAIGTRTLRPWALGDASEPTDFGRTAQRTLPRHTTTRNAETSRRPHPGVCTAAPTRKKPPLPSDGVHTLQLQLSSRENKGIRFGLKDLAESMLSVLMREASPELAVAPPLLRIQSDKYRRPPMRLPGFAVIFHGLVNLRKFEFYVFSGAVDESRRELF